MFHNVDNKTNLFLIELIISILFFSIASAICIQLFVQSHTLSQKTTFENNASLFFQNYSEVFYGTKGDFSSFKKVFQDELAQVNSDLEMYFDNTIILSYDSAWKLTNNISDTKYYLLAYFYDDTYYYYLDFYLFENKFDLKSTQLNKLNSIIENYDDWYFYHQNKLFKND